MSAHRSRRSLRRSLKHERRKLRAWCERQDRIFADMQNAYHDDVGLWASAATEVYWPVSWWRRAWARVFRAS